MGIRDTIKKVLRRDRNNNPPKSSGNSNLQSREPNFQPIPTGPYTPAPTNPQGEVTRGGGSSSGGGGSGGGSSKPNMTPIPNQSYASSSDLGGAKPSVSESVLQGQRTAEALRQSRLETKRQETRDVVVRRSGGVEVGNRRYIGDSVVPGTGMTANEYSRYIRQQAIDEGLVNKKDIGRAEFNVQRQNVNIKGENLQSKASESDLGIVDMSKYKDIKIDTKNLYFPGDKFVNSKNDIYGQGTGIPESITLEEKRRRENAKFKGDLFSVPISDITSTSRKYNELTKDLDKLSGEDLNIRLQELRNVGANINEVKTKEGSSFEITEPTVGIGFGSNKKEVPISKLNTRRDTRVLFSGISLEIEENAKRGASALGLKDTGIFTIPERKASYIEPVFGTAQIDPMTGRAITNIKRDIIIPAQSIGTPSQVGGITNVISRSLLFLPEEAGTIVETASSKRNVGTGLITYAKESPIEVATLATLGTLKGASVLARPVIKTESLVVKGAKPVVTIPRPYRIGGKTIYEDVTALSSTARSGQKTIVTSRFREIFGIKPIFSGNSQTALGKIEREKAKKLLGRYYGYSDKQVSQVLRLRRPKVTQQTFKGNIIVENIGDDVSLNIKGVERIKTKQGSLSNIKFLQKEPRAKIIDSSGVPIKENVVRLVEESKNVYSTPEGYLFSKLKEAGKTREVNIVLSSAKKTGESFIKKPQSFFDEIIPVEVYSSKGLSRGIVPAKRNIELSKEALIVSERGGLRYEIDFDEVVKDIGFKGGGSKSSPTFLKSLEQEEVVKSALVGRFGITGETITPQSSSIVESSITNIKSSPSIYAGLGTYEKTNTIGVINPTRISQTTQQNNIQTTSQSTKSELKPKQESISVSLTKLSSGSKNITKSITQPKQDSKQSNILRSATVQVSKSKQKLDLLTRSISKLTPRTTTTKTSIPKIPKIKIPTPQTPKEKSVAKQKVEDIFKAFGRVKGEDIELGEFKTQVGAERKLKTFLKTTLGASGKVKRGEEELEFSELGLFGGGEFRQSKVSPFRVVQKRERRLSTGQETSQIQFFKKQKGTKTRFL